jgi:hypothetical protein
LRSSDGAGDLKAPDLDGIDYMSINFAPVGFGGWRIEYAVRLPILEDVPFLRGGPQR